MNSNLPQDDNGFDECNTIDYAFTLCAERAPDSRRYELVDEGRNSRGQPIEKRMIFTTDDKFPHGSDADLLLGLQKLTWSTNRMTSPEVPFVRADLIRAMRRNREGTSYSAIKKGMSRIASVRIESVKGFWDHKSKKLIHQKFGILSFREEGGQWVFSWDGILWRSMTNNYIKGIDEDLYYSLRSTLQKRIYRVTDRQLRKQRKKNKPLVYTENAKTFSRVRLGRAFKDYYPSEIKRDLSDHFEALVERGILRDVSYKGRGKNCILSVVGGEYYERAMFQKSDRTSRGTSTDGVATVVSQLTQRGYSSERAQVCVEQYGVTEVLSAIEIYDAAAQAGRFKSCRRDRQQPQYLAGILRERNGERRSKNQRTTAFGYKKLHKEPQQQEPDRIGSADEDADRWWAELPEPDRQAHESTLRKLLRRAGSTGSNKELYRQVRRAYALDQLQNAT